MKKVFWVEGPAWAKIERCAKDPSLSANSKELLWLNLEMEW